MPWLNILQMHQNGIVKVYLTVLKYLLYILKAEGIKISDISFLQNLRTTQNLNTVTNVPHKKAQLKEKSPSTTHSKVKTRP